MDDFERVIDEHTGEYVYRFRPDVADRKGFIDLMEVNFDVIKDNKTGKQFVQIKSIPTHLNFQSKIYLIV